MIASRWMTRRSKSEEAALDFALYDLKSMIVYDTDACDNQRAVRVTKLSVRNDRAIYIYILQPYRTLSPSIQCQSPFGRYALSNRRIAAALRLFLFHLHLNYCWFFQQYHFTWPAGIHQDNIATYLDIGDCFFVTAQPLSLKVLSEQLGTQGNEWRTLSEEYG